MSLNQWNNHEKVRMQMENDYLEQKFRGDDPERAREIYNGKARVLFLLVVLVILLAALGWVLARM